MKRRKTSPSSTRSPRTRGPQPQTPRDAEEPERHESSPTAVAIEAVRTGVLAVGPREPEIPGGEDKVMSAGDPDVSPLSNAHSGEEIPGADMPTPDQSVVDEIGRAYGLQVGDSDPVRTSGQVLDKRDRRSHGRQPASKRRL